MPTRRLLRTFKSLVKEKYKLDVEVKPSYATGQEDFYNAAKNGTADLDFAAGRHGQDTPVRLFSRKAAYCCLPLT